MSFSIGQFVVRKDDKDDPKTVYQVVSGDKKKNYTLQPVKEGDDVEDAKGDEYETAGVKIPKFVKPAKATTHTGRWLNNHTTCIILRQSAADLRLTFPVKAYESVCETGFVITDPAQPENPNRHLGVVLHGQDLLRKCAVAGYGVNRRQRVAGSAFPTLFFCLLRRICW